jgi:hypothetical protein
VPSSWVVVRALAAYTWEAAILAFEFLEVASSSCWDRRGIHRVASSLVAIDLWADTTSTAITVEAAEWEDRYREDTNIGASRDREVAAVDSLFY